MSKYYSLSAIGLELKYKTNAHSKLITLTSQPQRHLRGGKVRILQDATIDL